MEQIIKLDKEDIKKIIVEKFNVSEEVIKVATEKVYRGYGPNEYAVEEPCVTILIKSGVKL